MENLIDFEITTTYGYINYPFYVWMDVQNQTQFLPGNETFEVHNINFKNGTIIIVKVFKQFSIFTCSDGSNYNSLAELMDYHNLPQEVLNTILFNLDIFGVL